MADMDEGELDAARMVAVDQRSEAVNALLASRDFAAAVAKALDNPPIGTKTAAIKVRRLEGGGRTAPRRTRTALR